MIEYLDNDLIELFVFFIFWLFDLNEKKESAKLHKKENKRKRNREVKVKANDQSRRRNAFFKFTKKTFTKEISIMRHRNLSKHDKRLDKWNHWERKFKQKQSSIWRICDDFCRRFDQFESARCEGHDHSDSSSHFDERFCFTEGFQLKKVKKD